MGHLLTCPVCGDTGYDELGMAIHFSDCEKAKELVSAYHKKRQQWETEHHRKLFTRTGEKTDDTKEG